MTEELEVRVSQAESDANSVKECISLVGEALELVTGMLKDLVAAREDIDPSEYADDLDRLAWIGNYVRLIS
jgi:hypothetical protein